MTSLMASRGSVPLRVLIADDDAISALICSRALSAAGYATTVVQNGAEALAMLERERFDMVIADILMPDMDGLALVRQMRSDERLTRLPVLFLTGCSEHEMRTRGYRAGGDGYLVKPIRPPDLVDQVDTLMSRATSTGAQLSGAFLSGRLDGISVTSLLTFLHVQGRSGLLRLSRFGATGEIAVREGLPLNANINRSLAGEEALAALLGWNAGTFRFERYDVSELAAMLRGPFTELIQRAQQRLERS
jgi:CheY-like chemotaxis protein